MQEFVTLEKAHPQFRRHLLGYASGDKIPLPVKSFNVNQQDERVTFQLIPRYEIHRPQILVILYQLFRLDLLALTFMPAVTTLLMTWSEIRHFEYVGLSLLALLFLHAAVFCRNDFVDHMRGIDRLNEKSGSQIIQRGWLKAASVQKLYWSLLAVAFILVLPVLIYRPELMVLSVVVALLGVLGYSHLRWGAVHWFFGDLAIWSCLGVFISIGMSLVAIGEVHLNSLLLGSYFGLLAVAYVESRHMISMVVDYEARLLTLPVRLGFDGAKRALILILFLAAINIVGFMTLRFPNYYSLLALPMIAAIVFLILRINTIHSPLASTLYQLPIQFVNFTVFSGVFFILALFI